MLETIASTSHGKLCLYAAAISATFTATFCTLLVEGNIDEAMQEGAPLSTFFLGLSLSSLREIALYLQQSNTLPSCNKKELKEGSYLPQAVALTALSALGSRAFSHLKGSGGKVGEIIMNSLSSLSVGAILPSLSYRCFRWFST